jgi:hypothetical protein
MLVKMLIGISGGRHDGRQWPPAGWVLDIPDWEARDLVRSGFALNADPPPAQAALKQDWVDYAVGQGEDPAQAADMTKAELIEEAAAPPAGEPANVSLPAHTAAGPVAPESLPVPETSAGAGDPDTGRGASAEANPPAPADPKTAWIDYAVSQGAKADAAAGMTKADLMSRYGGRI